MKRYEKHIFICENKRPPDDPRGCCFDKGGSEIKAKFKKRLKELGFKSDVSANTAVVLMPASLVHRLLFILNKSGMVE